MAQFVLKIEKLSHIKGAAPIEMARAYGLHPRLWLLVEASGVEPFDRAIAIFF